MSNAAPAPNPAVPSARPQEPPPHAALVQMILSRWVTQMIATAAKLNIADLLASGPKPVEELARATGMHAPSLYRVLRALASLGIFAEETGQRFRLTPLAEPLRSDHSHSVRGVAVMFGEPWSVKPWLDLLESVRTGAPAFPRAMGKPVFEYFSENAEAGRVFQECMIGFSGLTRDAVAAAYDFSAVKTLVDVAGGVGSLLCTILKAHAHLRGILFDLPEVIAQAPGFLRAQGVESRCSTVAGSFMESVPPGGDAYMMKHILHDWDDDTSVQILRRCREAIPKDGRLLVVEMVIEPGNDPSLGKLLDIEMIVMTEGGRERSAADFAKIFEAAGFRLSRVIATQSPVSIIEGIPV